MSLLIASLLLCSTTDLPVAPEASPFAPDLALADTPEPTPLEAVYADPAEDAKALAEQYVDMLLTLASEQPPADCISYLQWRLSESIKDLRRQNDANHLNAG